MCGAWFSKIRLQLRSRYHGASGTSAVWILLDPTRLHPRNFAQHTATAQQVDGIQDPIGYKLTMDLVNPCFPSLQLFRVSDGVCNRQKDDSGSAAGKNKSKTANQALSMQCVQRRTASKNWSVAEELLEKKAWEVAVAPIQSDPSSACF